MSSKDVERFITDSGVTSQRLRHAIRQLVDGDHDEDSLIYATGLSHKTIRSLLDAAGTDLERSGSKLTIKGELRPTYKNLCAETFEPTDFYSGLGMLDEMQRRVVERDVSGVPATRRDLDHVQATVATVQRRALFLTRYFDVEDRSILFVGDHDLTSLAVSLLRPSARVSVVDLDDGLLAYIASRCLSDERQVARYFADLRFETPNSLRSSADLVFTDPPYTPDGIGVFLSHSLLCLNSVDAGRIVLAYGFSETRPDLGYSVQRTISELRLVVEAALPQFNSYIGAPTIGHSAALYVLRPSGGSIKAATRFLATHKSNIYTHGSAARESSKVDSSGLLGVQDLERVASYAGKPIEILVSPTRARSLTMPGCRRLSLDELLSGPNDESRLCVVDLGFRYSTLLCQVALAATAQELLVVVGNKADAVKSERGQAQWRDALSGRYSVVKIYRGFPNENLATVHLRLLEPPAGMYGGMLQRAYSDVREVLSGGLWPTDNGKNCSDLLGRRPIDLGSADLLRLKACAGSTV